MRRLSPATLDALSGKARLPRYDRDGLGIGIAHLGVGAFHRCHQAEFTDDAIEAAGGAWGVVGINLRPPALGPTLGAQRGLYTRWLRDGLTADAGRVIGCLKEVIDADADVAPAVAALARPELRIASLTITEKGYCHVPATGALDMAHPDALHDLAQPDHPRSAPGVLLAALDRRRRAGLSGLTVISCDNIPGNGAILEAVVLTLARARSPELARWIEDNARFPSTMVDRIVPATRPEDVAAFNLALGLEDLAPVIGEPFRQWVIEDRFVAGRPAWDAVGAQLVGDVAPYEQVKMRLLNGAQSALCYLGALAGLETTHDDIRHPVLAAFARRMLTEETIPTLPRAPGMEPYGYLELALARLGNSGIRHRNHQIATDGSRKIVQRLLNPLRERLAAGASADLLACAVAGFLAYHAKGATRFGALWTPDDPLARELGAAADGSGGDFVELARRALALRDVFGADLAARADLVKTLAGHLAGLLGPEPVAYLSGVSRPD